MSQFSNDIGSAIGGSASDRQPLDTLAAQAFPAQLSAGSIGVSIRTQISNPLLQLERFDNDWLLMRHGHAGSNQLNVIANSPAHDCAQFGLTPAGCAQVDSAIARVIGRAITLDREVAIYSSELRRAIQSAERVLALLKQSGFSRTSLTTDDRLNGRGYGEFDGGSINCWEEVKRHDILAPTRGYQRGESMQELVDRVGDFVLSEERRASGRAILVVSHSEVIQVFGFLTTTQQLPHYSDVPEFRNAQIGSISVRSPVPYSKFWLD